MRCHIKSNRHITDLVLGNLKYDTGQGISSEISVLTLMCGLPFQVELVRDDKVGSTC